MPTAGRLAGAITFGLFGWYLATITVGVFPESRPPGYWFPLCTLVALVLGWRFCGGRAGRGFNAATSIGLTTGVAIAFWVIFALAFDQMIENGMRLRYGGPMEAAVDTFGLMADWAVAFYAIPLVATLLIGSLVCAYITEVFARKYP